MDGPQFDLQQMYVSINAERERRCISWASLARQVGVSASTIRRFAEASDAEADGVLALVRWLGVAPEDYFAGKSRVAETLGPFGEGYVRVDMDLVARAQNDPRGAGGRSRTTIQRLVAAAHLSGQSVAALTRLSDV